MIFRNLRTLWCSEWALDDKLHFGKLQSVEKELHFAWACRKSLHQLQDALCQQVRALIDLRLSNCTLIKERSCSVPFFLLIWTSIYLVLAWTQLGSMCRWFGAFWECLVRLCEFIFLPTRPFHVMARSERWLNSGESATAACHREAQHHNRQEAGDKTEGRERADKLRSNLTSWKPLDLF